MGQKSIELKDRPAAEPVVIVKHQLPGLHQLREALADFDMSAHIE